MRRDALARRAEFVLVPVRDGPAGDGAIWSVAQYGRAVEQLIADYAADGWTVVAVHEHTAAPQVLFRRPLSPSVA